MDIDTKELISAIAAGVITAVLAWFHGHYIGKGKSKKVTIHKHNCTPTKKGK